MLRSWNKYAVNHAGLHLYPTPVPAKGYFLKIAFESVFDSWWLPALDSVVFLARFFKSDFFSLLPRAEREGSWLSSWLCA